MEIISIFCGPPLPPTIIAKNQRPKINNGPLYEVNEVIDRAKNNCEIMAITRKCFTDMAKLGKTTDQVRLDIIQGLSNGKFEGSEWCLTTCNNWGASDAYEMFRNNWKQRFYLKYFLCKDKNIFAISLHL